MRFLLALARAAATHSPEFVCRQRKRTFERSESISNMCCVASEKELILARAGLFGDSDGRDITICPKHRAELGVRFRPSMKCQHPLHGNRRRKVERGINLKMAKEINAKWNTVVPVGAGNFGLRFVY